MGVHADGDIYGFGCAGQEYGDDVIEDALNGGEQFDSAGNPIEPAYVPGDDWCPNCGSSLWVCSHGRR